MRVEFNLNYYLSHPDVKVVTRDGRGVRIICTDTKSIHGYVITALLDYGDLEMPLTYDPLGAHGTTHELDIDLFFEFPDSEKGRVPLTYEDLLERTKSGKTMWISKNSVSCVKFIIGYNKYNVGVIGSIDRPSVAKYSYQELMESESVFIDGTPCWKEVDE